MDSSKVRLAACVALPAIASLVFLLIVSVFVYGHAFRPGLYAELVLVLYASSLLLHLQRHKPRAAIVNTFLLLAFYGAYLVKFLVLREGVGQSDFESLPALLAFMPTWQMFALALACGVVGMLLATNLARPRLLPTAALLAPLVAYFIGCFFAPETVLGLLEAARPTSLIVELEPWRDGPLITTARQLPRQRTTRQFLTRPPESMMDGVDVQRRARALASLPPPRRNLHIILLESFVDPLNFRALDCPFDPVDARMRRWITEGDSIALAATFGGTSARSEFEILCGVPSFERLGIDFMALRGGAVPCLPHLLRQHGYATHASSSGTASFFNHVGAYAALGFENRHFEPEFVKREADMDGDLLSDEAYFPQTLRWVLPAIRNDRPFLNYVVTWAGHYPFALNPRRHPPICGDDKWAAKVANSAHYTSAAVADYVELIEASDPDAVVVVLSDHLPPLGFADSGFREADYRLRFHANDAPPFWAADNPSWLESRATTLVVRKARQPVSLGIIPHYLIPEALLDLLTDGAYCDATLCFRTMPILDRPHGRRPVFTAADAFPRSVCATEAAAGTPRCRIGVQLHRTLEAEYDALLRVGLQERRVPTAPAEVDLKSSDLP